MCVRSFRVKPHPLTPSPTRIRARMAIASSAGEGELFCAMQKANLCVDANQPLIPSTGEVGRGSNPQAYSEVRQHQLWTSLSACPRVHSFFGDRNNGREHAKHDHLAPTKLRLLCRGGILAARCRVRKLPTRLSLSRMGAHQPDIPLDVPTHFPRTMTNPFGERASFVAHIS